MYLFYNEETRKILFTVDMPMTVEEIAATTTVGNSCIEKTMDDFPDWSYELSDYYIEDDLTIGVCSEYNFDEITAPVDVPLSILIPGSNTTWIERQDTGTRYTLGSDNLISFTPTDPGLYKFIVYAKDYKQEELKIRITI